MPLEKIVSVRQVASAFAADAFGNALATEVIKYGQNAPVRALRKEIAETSPALLDTFESWIESGGTAESFKKFMANEKFASGIEQIQNAKDSAGTASSSRPDDYAIVGDKKLPVNEIERPTADKIFGGSSQVLQGLSELSDTVHLEEIAMMSKVILFGPASVIMDEAMGSIINNLAGDKVASGLHAAGVQLAAMAWGESADQTQALINANNNFDDSWLLDNSLNDAQRTEMLGYERAANIGYDRSRSAAGASDFLVLGMMALGAKQGFDLLRSRGFDRSSALKAQGFQDHHILSDKNKLTKNHELLELSGFDLQKRQNKMFLPTDESLHPTRSIHNGKHTNDVSVNLAEQMDAVVKAGKQNDWNQKQYKQALDAIITQERQALKSGERALNKNQRSWSQ